MGCAAPRSPLSLLLVLLRVSSCCPHSGNAFASGAEMAALGVQEPGAALARCGEYQVRAGPVVCHYRATETQRSGSPCSMNAGLLLSKRLS